VNQQKQSQQVKTKQRNPRPRADYLPLEGKSRWRDIEPRVPFGHETFRKLGIEGKAPPPERMGIRLTMYDNKELHKFIANPINYRFISNKINIPDRIKEEFQSKVIDLINSLNLKISDGGAVNYPDAESYLTALSVIVDPDERSLVMLKSYGEALCNLQKIKA